MAVVNGPLFSLDASGAVGKAIVYTKWKGRNVVREYVTPANPRSIAQRGRRTMMAILNAIWQAMGTTDRDSWADLAAAGNYSNFNGFTSYNLDLQTIEDPPTKNRSDTPTAISGAASFGTNTPGTNRIDFAVAVGTAQSDAYFVIALQEGASAPGVELLKAVAFGPTDATGTLERAVTDLPAGTYSATVFLITNDGTIAVVGDTDTSIVVTGTF